MKKPAWAIVKWKSEKKQEKRRRRKETVVANTSIKLDYFLELGLTRAIDNEH